MQNLRNVGQHIRSFAGGLTLSAVAWDVDDDSLICAFGPTEDDDLLSLKRWRPGQKGLESIAAWDARSPTPELNHDSIVDLHHFPETQRLVLILEGGDIIVVRESPQDGEDAVEIVGSINDGIAAAVWSPDDELVLVVTKTDTILLITKQFESTATIALTPDDLKVSNHVSVGWGKVETQFKGRGAKAMRDPTLPEHVDSGVLSSHDRRDVQISWRGDGQYMAVNSILRGESDRRVVRVFSRDGSLESVTEPIDGLEGALAWKPSGQTIAGICRTSSTAQVVFFERNGLRHGEFDLRLTTLELDSINSLSLHWNLDSTVLAIVLDGRVQLWTTSNYHWYLKQDLDLRFDQERQTFIRWHPEKALFLAAYDTQRLIRSQHALCYSTGSFIPPYDQGLVATIDGKRLAITPMKLANVPPPMSYDEIQLLDHAVDVCFQPNDNRLAVLHRSSITMYEYDYASRPAKKAKHCHTFELGSARDTVLFPRLLSLEEHGTAFALLDSEDSQTSVLAEAHASQSKATFTPLPYYASCGVSVVGGSQVQLYDEGGAFREEATVVACSASIPSGSSTCTARSLPPGCVDVCAWQQAETSISIGRTNSGQLHIRSNVEELKINGCTSLALTDSHLIFTTSQQLLKFVHLWPGKLEVPADEPEKDERCRSIERGAKIVTVIPSIFAVVLQMPRGNLETVYPRALVLAGIRQQLLAREYKNAFMICRAQRVDPNILYDYVPKQLLGDVGIFIKQLHKVDYIDLFLSSLTEDDTSSTLYYETAIAPAANGVHEQAQLTLNHPDSSKVNTVCDAFINALSNHGPAYTQCIITAYISKSPPDLEAGLRLISQLRERVSVKEAEQAVEHICFLGDVNRLYDTALGIYDLEVTLLVAQQSQKDPREYLPYLQSLRDMSVHRRQYTIDNDLKRHVKALSALHTMDAFDELLHYVDRYVLFAEAVELYRHERGRLHQLMRLHAEFLSSRNRYADAGMAFEFIGDYRAAFQAYRAANLWKETVSTAALVPVSREEELDLAQTLADGLIEAKDYISAALIHLDYLGDLSGAVILQCKAYQFSEAMRLCVLRGQAQLLEQIVDPGLIEASGVMTEMLAEMKNQLNSQIPRLRELRAKKIEEPMAFLDTGENENTDFPDNLSVAATDASTSGGTFMTRYTNHSTGTLGTNATRRTSRNRRREERKRARGKKGTVYEEEYLVNSIGRLVERLNETGKDVTSLVQGLMRRSMRERAAVVEKAAGDVEAMCKEHMAEVFQSAFEPQAQHPDDQQEERRPPGGQGVLWDSFSDAHKKVEAPLLKSFEKLSLLSG